MKRSAVNQALRDAVAFFRARGFETPRWAHWSPEEWQKHDTAEIIACGLGWDVTDFGSSDFTRIGLVNLNLRNGVLGRTRKTYCEKVLIVQEDQVTPLHTHRRKVEDVINRGGGNLVIELQASDADLRPNGLPVTVAVDALARTVPSGGAVVLAPGESICLESGVYHRFYGQRGAGAVLVGEVSTVNDDLTDNVFSDAHARFPTLEEDEPPIHLLAGDYSRYLGV